MQLKKRVFTVIFIAFQGILYAQGIIYDNAFVEIKKMLDEDVKMDFSTAVFKSENAFFDDQLSKSQYDVEIHGLKTMVYIVMQNTELRYEAKDKNLITKYASLFRLLTEEIPLIVKNDTLYHLPFTYDFEDVFGAKDWTKMFLGKLLATQKGNCHSMPYLYKILCDELNIPCHLALAPNHIYIKHRTEKGGWYNVELTSASFPTDAWLMASGYISLEAVQNSIYLDTLSEKESIALCVIDLAQGYNHKYPDNDGTFVIQCCDLALKHFPKYTNAILLKAETRLKQLQAMQKQYGYAYLKEVTKLPEGKKRWDEMNSLYMQLYQLGYRQMPEQMYVEWLASLKTEKEKYTNKQVEQMNRN